MKTFLSQQRTYNTEYRFHNACGDYLFNLQSKYKEASKKEMQSGSFTTLSETRDTAHSREVKKLVSGVWLPQEHPPKYKSHILYQACIYYILGFFVLQKVYKAKFEKEKGKSIYNLMTVPPDVQHAMDVAKNQSNVGHLRCCWASGNPSCISWCFCFPPTPQVSYKKDAKASLHYTTIADRPDIKKATQAAKLISDVIRQHTHQNLTSPIHLQLDADSESVGFGVFSETMGKHHRWMKYNLKGQYKVLQAKDSFCSCLEIIVWPHLF